MDYPVIARKQQELLETMYYLQNNALLILAGNTTIQYQHLFILAQPYFTGSSLGLSLFVNYVRFLEFSLLFAEKKDCDCVKMKYAKQVSCFRSKC